MGRVKIRYASKKDLPAIVQLMKELGYPIDENLIEGRLEKIRQRNGRVIVAVDETEEVIGCVHAFIDLRLAEGEIGEIVSLVVKQDAHGQGIGTKLLDEVKKWVHQSGCTTIRVRANAIRENAHEFYKKHGFEEIKNQKIFQTELID